MEGVPALIGAAAVAIWIYLVLFRGSFWRLPEPPLTARTGPPRAVVAVVPARDEAECIDRAIGSLLDQDHPGRLHVILVDDHSRDGTAALARAAAERRGAQARLTVCRGRPLPPGWTGKLWAVRQGIETARALAPDGLLLTDADIAHQPSNVSELVAHAERGGYDLISLMVRLNCRSFWERLLIPAFVFFFFKIYPPRWVADPARQTSAAAGGCMLIRPSALDQIGGIGSIRGEIIDDCALARRVKAVGGAVWLGSSAATRSLREYRRWQPIWQMIARTAFAQLGYSPALLAGALVALALAYLSPPLLLLSSDPAARLLGATAWLAMAAAFLPILRAYDGSRIIALVLPLITLFYGAATIASAVAFWRGHGGWWKGRFQAAGQRPKPG
jgi:hopene-associated glycosyltransferase HpnB